ncbi:MAG: helix-turn-helix transcriptional regulator, partial [Nitrospirales bacterium]|nr:helix-turn-helix transcriptional regulator [Nitrospirales bacterium]
MKKKLPGTKKTNEDGRSEVKASISNSVLSIRKAKGMAQGELADRVGLTRQAMYDIEANHYLPSTAIALRLAQVLDCRVEDLFSLSKKGEAIEAEFIGDHARDDRPVRVNLAHVGDRVIARPIAELGDVLNFVVPADGIVTAPFPEKHRKIHQRVLVELLHDRKEIEKHIVIAGCDPSMFIAGGHVRHLHGLSGITNWTMGSAN